ncbi:MAG: hypothetical protein A2504_03500 [Bdellovibrionales bacterium RIFOXYD12_FULL_39_22]|nr:MAG: hypothetical protein A2385_11250 [Bdellovibrionales bacterium RIFOXYB1_FULL_39_21]OFZ41645.1 MAG: hypothetical protein A2485_01560 [Bdellovibrionales bacterium RIFOXYC12_FULL_39_17]OFZ46045.1 MAG: hypothetical protein A2404_11925 [Bdellovibrionales bacterium RIFOXYC1_FULL_39_130]OFZ74872.1 MAG: hypothetical protein A2560_14965 [Bdellovibrionales bacterium RIFOXYD1_FULL_39_84]OFZ92725.1 MAG: hypothetical protein A2504_03500 [Bdellovibrionales bacterium RIFOXYD12_FULL_39_22]HLE12505.1 AA
MHMYARLANPLELDNFFLFGARGVGKTTLLSTFFKEKKVLRVDLLLAEEEERFSGHPDQLKELIAADSAIEWVVIDEIQKIPKLLDIVHSIIETKENKVKFALTGSSAKKLKRGSANLLAGRALINNLFPLTFLEMGEAFDLEAALSFGLLPKIVNTENSLHKSEILKSYTQAYLKEEVWAEQMVKNLAPFRKFLEVAAQMNTEIINYSKIARTIGVATHTVQGYFQILEDTLLAHILEPFNTSVRKRLISAPKFYFFDIGVKRALDRTINQTVVAGTYEYGRAFEHFIITQLIALNSYYRSDFRFGYLKTKDGLEIDLIIERPGQSLVLLEIKSSINVDKSDLLGLRSVVKDFPGAVFLCACQDKLARRMENIYILPWKKAIEKIFNNGELG